MTTTAVCPKLFPNKVRAEPPEVRLEADRRDDNVGGKYENVKLFIETRPATVTNAKFKTVP